MGELQDLSKGEGLVQTNIPEILEWGTQGILNQKFWKLNYGTWNVVMHHRLFLTTCVETNNCEKPYPTNFCLPTIPSE